jgi:hypothetical protein
MEKAERAQHQQVRHPGRREVQPDTRGETPAGDSTTINRRGEAEAGGATDKGTATTTEERGKEGVRVQRGSRKKEAQPNDKQETLKRGQEPWNLPDQESQGRI